MTAAVKRRGMIRPISDLPVSPGGAALMEVEVAGAAYRAAVGGGGGLSVWNQYTALQCPYSADFVDLKGNGVTIAGAPTIVADGAAPGGFSAQFHGAGDKLTYTTSQGDSLDLRGVSWTIEFGLRTSINQQYTTIYERGIGATGGFTVIINNDSSNDGRLAFYQNVASLVVKTANGGFNDGVRHHVAICRVATSFYIFIDGVQQGLTVYNSFDVFASGSQALDVGNSSTANRDLTGFLDNLRFTRGIPMYATHFTAPTSPFPTS